MLKNHSSLSHSPTKSPSKLFRYSSNADLLASPKKGNKYKTASVPSSPVKGTSSAAITETKVWDMEMQTVTDVRIYFAGIKTDDIDVGMVKKLWQLLRNESMLYTPEDHSDDRWIEQFLKQDGFGLIVGVLKDMLAIEWRLSSYCCF